MQGARTAADTEGEPMKKRIALLAAAMALASSGVASAAITQSTNNGHPNTNPTGKCPPGQNQGATPGALQKCS
jgi:hypothetical protein